MLNSNMRITVITSTYNCADALKRTAYSIRRQSYKNIQWIIADGASNDATMTVITDNIDIITDWFSEPDTGIYDAWNKACRLINGEWVIFLGAGDLFWSDETVYDIVQKIQKIPKYVEIIYGDVYREKNNKLLIHSSIVDFSKWDIYRPRLPCHQGVLQPAKSLKTDCPFDSSYRVVADSKFLLTILKNKNTYYLNQPITIMDMLGISSNIKNSKQVMDEFLRLEKDLNYNIPPLYKAYYILTTNIKILLFKLNLEIIINAIKIIKWKFIF